MKEQTLLDETAPGRERTHANSSPNKQTDQSH